MIHVSPTAERPGLTLSCLTRWRRRAEGNYCCGTFQNLQEQNLLHKEEAKSEYAWKHVVVRGGLPVFSRNAGQGFRLVAGSHMARELKGGQFLDLLAFNAKTVCNLPYLIQTMWANQRWMCIPCMSNPTGKPGLL